MSMTFYCYRPDHTIHEIPADLREDLTAEQEIDCGWVNGPNLSNSNALMVIRSLELDDTELRETGSAVFDAHDLKARLLLATVVGGSISDTGQPDTDSNDYGNLTPGCRMIDCGVRPGYFADVYSRLLPVCEQAIRWNVDVTVA